MGEANNETTNQGKRTMTLESGFYVRSEENDATTICGPFATADHAWCNFYANDQLDSRKSDRNRKYMISKDGDYLMISEARWIQEDIDNEELELRLVLTPVPTPIYSNLIGEDGLLSF